MLLTEPRPEHKPQVSVVLLAYNHLDYTKQCYESLIAHTDGVDYELITVDNGSTDGTAEYFDSLPHKKKLRFEENIGVDRAINRGLQLGEGTYLLNLSNDIVVTDHWLKNLVSIMESDERVAMAVPVCGFSSNHQQVKLPYETLEQLHALADRRNRSNPRLWEDRMKLVTYTCLFRAKAIADAGWFDEEFNPGAYDDDAISFTLRRMGWRLILAGDTYVHHFGSVTFNAEYAKNNLPLRNRALFLKKFGVDSWAAAHIDMDLVNLHWYKRQGPVRILGLGSSCGSTLLQIKNMYRHIGVDDVAIDYLTDAPHTLADLFTICRKAMYGPFHSIGEEFPGPYDLIVVESATDGLADISSLYGELCALLPADGQLITTATAKTLPIIRETVEKQGLSLANEAKGYYFRFDKT